MGCGFFYACYTEAMRFAEVFLRLGSSLVGWMLVYTYTVWLAALHVMGCGPDGDGMHRLLFGLAPFAVVMALPLRLTRPFPDIQRMLSWLGVPIILLLPFVLRNIWHVFEQATLGGLAICSDAAASTVHVYWAPVQFLALGLIVVLIAGEWRSARIEKH